MKTMDTPKGNKHSVGWWIGAGLTAAILALIATVLVGTFSNTQVGHSISGVVNALLATDSGHATWYVTRSAGFISYFLLWFSTVWGLAISSKIFDRLLHRAYTFDFHEFLSLLSIGFLVLHVVVLTADQYLPYSVAQILVPFLSPYRPVWVGVGVIAAYLMLLVSVTFYVRSRIGMKAFRVIHVASFVAYFGGAVHGLLSGTDSPLAATQLMYAGTFLVVVFLTVYWVVMARLNKTTPVPAPKAAPARQAAPLPGQPARTGLPSQPRQTPPSQQAPRNTR